MNEYYDMTFEDALTEFAKRDTAGFLVWGTKLNTAHKREVAAKDAEIANLHKLIEGLLKASTVECTSCDYDCGQNREHCIIRDAEKHIEKGEVER